MNNTIRNTLLVVMALAVVSLSARNFGGAATTTSTAPARHYYLTKAAFAGNQALTACASGYHFASFAEIMDPAVLTYNKTLGRSLADDGAGPPSEYPGWVRTGYLSSSQPSGDGPANCSLWTSASSSDQGEVGLFDPAFNATNGNVLPVVTFTPSSCDDSSGVVGVWCVEN
jgi:hypothetical protein